ncbi:MAG: hypothetical protein HOE11_01955 [Candidatus Diapherotrites archaeon]|jgi:hypothetical protein|nr:hypothetical protein [Candidatus Diapherotrites archaeon]MBT4596690.1 hypothetical protein [Candidatus Diapherotrites archaeon]
MEKRVFIIAIAVIFCLAFAIAANTVADIEVEVVGGTTEAAPTVTTTLASGESVIYYLRALNKEVLLKAPTSSGDITVAAAEKLKSQVAPTASTAISQVYENKDRAVRKFTWAGVPVVDIFLSDNAPKPRIIFPEVNCGSSVKQTLALSFSGILQGSGAGKIITVWVKDGGGDFERVQCYTGISKLLHAGEAKVLQFITADSKTCYYKVCGGENVANFTLQEKGDKYDIIIESPLVPKECNQKSISHTSVANSRLVVPINKLLEVCK